MRILVIKTYLKLGVINLLQVFWYRLKLKNGKFKSILPIAAPIRGPFFEIDDLKLRNSLNQHDWISSPWVKRESNFFGNSVELVEKIPSWNINCLNKKKIISLDHWSEISDFKSGVGDIKGIWEASRFSWAMAFCGEFLQTANNEYIEKINLWLEDWSINNPANQGPNWKCGQETSIRVMHLCIIQSLISDRLSTPLEELLIHHLNRIEPTISYAKAQDNNHGTSEAASLFMGGLLIHKCGRLKNQGLGLGWYKLGRATLENRVHHLISVDGTFSQYSVNYHRVVMDTLSFTEWIRRHFNATEFSKKFYFKAKQASKWSAHFLDIKSGDAPNIGANDGADLFPIVHSDYRNFKLSANLALSLFANLKLSGQDKLSSVLMNHLNIPIPENEYKIESKIFSQGGFTHLVQKDSHLYFRNSNFKFRPSHCDVFHIDLWVKGVNLLLDAGTFSYNTSPDLQDYFPSLAAHNTIQFDVREQMPRISRFLLGAWLNTKLIKYELAKEQQEVISSYVNFFGVKHKRAIKLKDSSLLVIDNIKDFTQKAVVRWRVPDLNWELDGLKLFSNLLQIEISSTQKINRIELVEGYTSLYYNQKAKVKVLEVELIEPGEISSLFKWN
jgi:hypothetical protein